MRRSHITMLVAGAVALYIALTALYFGTGYVAARNQVIAVALGAPMPGPGLADNTWGVRLEEPGIEQLVVSSAGLPQPTSLISATYTFILSNSADSRVPPLTVFVAVRLTWQGWSVTGDGVPS